MSDKVILSIDQGTTSSRAVVLSQSGQALSIAQKELTQHYPESGWVEHDPVDIWQDTLSMCRQALQRVPNVEIVGIGITNQRETTILWNRHTGKTIYPAIVWQDRRTADFYDALKSQGHEEMIHARTGLLLDAYFSAGKIKWILDNVAGARAAAEAGDLAFGTVDSWLIWNLTGGKVHATDATNASRTSLFNISTNAWDETLLRLFDIPAAILPEVKECADDFGMTEISLFGTEIPIAGVAGDQHAASFGQACFQVGMMKSTYGTGCFALVNTGVQQLQSTNRLISTIAYRLNGETVYALEGSIFMAGAIMQWLRDGLNLVRDTSETEALALAANPDNEVVLVPAFTGLGAPHWRPEARAAIMGLTRNAGKAEIAHAALQAVSLQTEDLLIAMRSDMSAQGLSSPSHLRVDGGMVNNNWFVQNLSDITDIPIDRPVTVETTALGVAYLAGLQQGMFDTLDDITEKWQLDRSFKPLMPSARRETILSRWSGSISKILHDEP